MEIRQNYYPDLGKPDISDIHTNRMLWLIHNETGETIAAVYTNTKDYFVLFDYNNDTVKILYPHEIENDYTFSRYMHAAEYVQLFGE